MKVDLRPVDWLGKDRPIIVMQGGSDGTSKGNSFRNDSIFIFGDWHNLVALTERAKRWAGVTQSSFNPFLITSNACNEQI